MTAEPATYPAMFVLEGGSPRRLDPVRARIAAGQQIIHSQGVLMTPEETSHRGVHLPLDARTGGPRRPHPGDVLYWVACLGGVCLLLLSATT